MIVVDTSAIVAIFEREPEADDFVTVMEASSSLKVSAASVLETAMVLTGRYPSAPAHADEWIDRFLADAGIEVAPVTSEQIKIAQLAFRRFGKGMGQGAGLNFGDCFVYGLAKALDAPLLFKGNDFVRTDIVSALA